MDRPIGTSVVAVLVLFMCMARPAAAEPLAAGGVIPVTTTDDELATDGDCSLREAVRAANTNAAVDACPAGSGELDEIVLVPGLYTLTLAGAGEDLGATGDLDITESVNITSDFEVEGVATIDGAGLDRIFDVADGVGGIGFWSLVLKGGDAGSGPGGAIRLGDACQEPSVWSNVTLADLVVTGNHAASGGGVHVGACRDVVVERGSFTDNTADLTGGGLSVLGESMVVVANSTFSGNNAGEGGGMWAHATGGGGMSIVYTTIARNAAVEGAGVWVAEPAADASYAINASITGDNEGPNCGGAGFLGGNVGISDDDTCGTVPVSDVGLLPLTQSRWLFVHGLAPTSPAIDFVDSPACGSSYPLDQAGNPRPVDGDGSGTAECDAGSVEAPAVAPNASASPSEIPDTSLPMDDGRPAGSPLIGLALLAVLGVLAAASSARLDRATRGRP